MVLTAIGSAEGEKARAIAAKAGAGHSCCDGNAAGHCQIADGRPNADARTIILASQKAVAKQSTAKKGGPSPAALAKGVAARKALLAQVEALTDEGKAECCIHPGCAMCVIATDGCGCSASLSEKGPVCPECWGGWLAGQGMLDDVDPTKVQVFSRDTLKKVYEMRADKLEKAEK